MDAEVAGAVYFLRGYLISNNRNYLAKAHSLGVFQFLLNVRRVMPTLQHNRPGTDR
jgi:hypothetical protein